MDTDHKKLVHGPRTLPKTNSVEIAKEYCQKYAEKILSWQHA